MNVGHNENGSLPVNLGKMIDVRKPYLDMGYTRVRKDSFKNIRVAPFPKSTLIVEEYLTVLKNGTSTTLNFVTRDLEYMQFNLTTYTDSGRLQKIA